MRPIKFRAWDKEKKVMFDVQSLGIWQVIPVVYAWHFGDSMPTAYDYPMRVELMQFTGLHDKNGKEIWEGDVVQHSRFLPFQIYWDDENAAFCGRSGTDDGSWISNDRMSGMAKYGEVIGNIYENGDLLK